MVRESMNRSRRQRAASARGWLDGLSRDEIADLGRQLIRQVHDAVDAAALEAVMHPGAQSDGSLRRYVQRLIEHELPADLRAAYREMRQMNSQDR
jgi:hypothetical protein